MRPALALTLMLAASACASRPPPAPGEAVIAVAYRDAVPGYQRLGTRGFSRPYLERSYDQVLYLEEDLLGPQARLVLAQTLEQALREGRAVDLFLLINGGHFESVVGQLPEELRGKLRLVYNTGAGGGFQQRAWLDLGVKAYVSHPGSANLAPFFYVDFLRNWVGGQPLEQAVAGANASLHDRLSGFSAPLLLKASGFPARDEDLPYWEEATRATVAGEPGLKLR